MSSLAPCFLEVTEGNNTSLLVKSSPECCFIAVWWIFFSLKALASYMEAKCSWKTQEVSLIVLKSLSSCQVSSVTPVPLHLLSCDSMAGGGGWVCNLLLSHAGRFGSRLLSRFHSHSSWKWIFLYSSSLEASCSIHLFSGFFFFNYFGYHNMFLWINFQIGISLDPGKYLTCII